MLIRGTRRGLTPKLIANLRRRSAIEAEIGRIKTDGRLARCSLKGTLGDALFAVHCGCGHNIRKILPHLGALLGPDHRRDLERTSTDKLGWDTRRNWLIWLFRAN